ncbi:hypothetical protein ES332_A04G190100v1 [Gossypium tomentosum]|uniref:H15 domain-containing protein n=1 Tax=Gossypium tomentosum TaxID=34277 RepID=A0A5D2R457_GOSTO|nr:hypothetical protein ES332_A04G190100v1 [Gossypium tomentosum]
MNASPSASIPADPPPPPTVPAWAPAQPSVVEQPAAASAVPPVSDHPPYSDMIIEAIGALKEKNGSSKRAISKYIELAHKPYPPSHDELLTQDLKLLKSSGQLVMVRKSYKLAPSAGSEVPVPDSATSNVPDDSLAPKRGRGRPPKAKPTVSATDSGSQLVDVPVAGEVKKSVGRPRKNAPIGQLDARRGRGRPPKSGSRRPKTVRSVVAGGANAVKRGRGRPPRAVDQVPQQGFVPIQGQPVAVPYADADPAAPVAPSLPRRRGRPNGTARATGTVVPGKRRGRPPKVGSNIAPPLATMAKKTTGRPVGRPKKTTGGASAATYEDLKTKLEFFQSKVKHAVEVLKTQCINNETGAGAIQELEGLAEMDINAPFRRQAQPPQQVPTQPPILQNEGQGP